MDCKFLARLILSIMHFQTCTQRFWLGPVDIRGPTETLLSFHRPMHLRPLPDKGKYKFKGVKMEMLVTKFSNEKYCNEGELFAEPISYVNVTVVKKIKSNILPLIFYI